MRRTILFYKNNKKKNLNIGAKDIFHKSQIFKDIFSPTNFKRKKFEILKIIFFLLFCSPVHLMGASSILNFFIGNLNFEGCILIYCCK